MRHTILFLLLLGTCVQGNAQREAENWYFGLYSGVSFASGEPVNLPPGGMRTREGCVSVSDVEGRLLFYSDGIRVWAADHTLLQNGTGLNGNSSSTQSCIAIPFPGRAAQYILATVDATENDNRFGLQYSVVDMAADGGRGAVVLKNQPLEVPAQERVTAVRHANGVDAWIIGQAKNTNEFVAFLVTSAGVNTTPIRQAIGPRPDGSSIGYLKASHQGTQLAMAVTVSVGGSGGLWLYTFDPATAELSDEQQLSWDQQYGIEFSPNGRFLYAASVYDAHFDQYDLSAPFGRIANTRTTVGADSRSGALQLAPNGRIYIAHEDKYVLSEIRSPDSAYPACDYRFASVPLDRAAQLGLPNFSTSVFAPPAFDVVFTGRCEGDTIAFSITPPSFTGTVSWDFGDPASGAQNTANGAMVEHVFTDAGVFTVTTYATYAGRTDTVTTQVSILAAPNVSAGSDVSICRGDVHRVNARGAVAYTWSPGTGLSDSTVADPVASPLTTTVYTVRGVNAEGCVAEDTVTIVVHDPEVSVMADTTICEGDLVALSATGRSRVQWQAHPDITDPLQPVVIVAPRTTTTYTVWAADGDCVSQPKEVTVTVRHAQTDTLEPMVIQVRTGARATFTHLVDEALFLHQPIAITVRHATAMGRLEIVPRPWVVVDSVRSYGPTTIHWLRLARTDIVPVQLQFEVQSYLARADSTVMIHVQPQGCANRYVQPVVIQPDHCGDELRQILIGAHVAIAVRIRPHPVSELSHLDWESDNIGRHCIRVCTTHGVVVQEYTFTRTLASATSGSIPLDLSQLGRGLYVVTLETPSGSVVEPLVH